MKTPKAIEILIPEELQNKLNKELRSSPPQFPYSADYMYHLLDHILFKQSQTRLEFVKLDYRTLVKQYNTSVYIKYLIIGEILETDNNYEPGIKSKGYRIKYSLLNSKIVKYQIMANTSLWKKLKKMEHNRKAHVNRLKHHIKAMRDVYMNLEIDHQEALKYAEKRYNGSKLLYCKLSLFAMQDKRLRYFRRNKRNNRLDSNLTNLKKDFRQFLIGDFVAIDLKNSQPFLFSILLKEIINNNKLITPPMLKELKKEFTQAFGIKLISQIQKAHHFDKKRNFGEVLEYTQSVSNGSFYDDLVANYNGEYSRDEVKKIVLAIFYSPNKIYENYKTKIPYKLEKRIFRKAYPFISDVMEILKSKDHKIHSVFMQNLESYIFIDVIAKKLVEAGIIPLTIHDSIIVRSEQANNALEIIEEVFRSNFDCVPTFHIKKLK